MANTENDEEGRKTSGANAGSESRFCPNCGNPRKPDSVFCYKCGFKLEPGGEAQKTTGDEKETRVAEVSKEPKVAPDNENAPVISEKPPAKSDESVDVPSTMDQPPPLTKPPSNVPWYKKPLWLGCGILGGIITLGLITILGAMGTCLCLSPNAASDTQTTPPSATTPSQPPASTGPKIEYFTASCPEPSPTVIVSGKTCGLSWSVSGPDDTKVTINPDIGTVELSGMVKVERGGVYTITATSKGGLAVKSITAR